jgi:hypothetical protein
MNYFAHGLPHVDRPYFLAGGALPDWLSAVDRKVRLRSKLLQPQLESADPVATELAAGALRHLHDDEWFHSTRGFVEVSAELTKLFRTQLDGGDGFYCGFLGHIATELLIDGCLAERYPAHLDRFYEALEQVDAETVTNHVAAWVGRPPESLAWFIELFRRLEYLRDYSDDGRLLLRLNQVLGRVKLTPLPDAAVDWLAPARVRIRERLPDLLPATQYEWPEESK